MRLLPLLVLLLLAGCSQPTAPSISPQSPPEPTSGQFETSAQINEEIYRQYPLQSNTLTTAKGVQVIIGILDGAKSEKTLWAVKDWATDNNKMILSMQPSPSARTQAGINSYKWLIAAAEAKKATLLTSNSPDYETAKKNALSEAARADSLPVN